MIECNTVDAAWKTNVINHYCPQFSPDHFLSGGFYASRYAWARLAIHFCDDSPEAQAIRAQKGKGPIKCASK